mgnify:FL=1
MESSTEEEHLQQKKGFKESESGTKERKTDGYHDKSELICSNLFLKNMKTIY